MLSKSMGLRTLAAVLLLAVFMAGCTTATASVTPTATGPTANALPTFDQVRTQAAQTVAAGLTQAALSATPVPPTNTSAPTFTNTPAFTATPVNTNTPVHTNTPIPPTPRPTATWIPWTLTPVITSTPVGSPTPVGFGCMVTSVSPKSTDTLSQGQYFDGNWVVKNTGSVTWSKAEVDIKYISGTKMQKAGEDLLDTKSDTAVGSSYTAIVNMIAPSNAGTYNAVFALTKNMVPFCMLNLTVVVK